MKRLRYLTLVGISSITIFATSACGSGNNGNTQATSQADSNASAQPLFIPYANGACMQNTKTGDIWATQTSYDPVDEQGGMSWDDALSYAQSFNTQSMCGFDSGWTLPSQAQLLTLATYTPESYIVGCGLNCKMYEWYNDQWFHPNFLVATNYWGNDEDSENEQAWEVNMTNGQVAPYGKQYGLFVAWPVHSAP